VTRNPTERGIALLLAIAILAAISTMTLTALALARMERVAGVAAVSQVQARAAAESALAEAMQGWASAFTPLTPGAEATLATVTVPGSADGRASVRALGGPVYAIRAEGARISLAGDTLGSARLELLVLLDAPDSLGRVHPRSYPRGWRLLP
jgi:hypothetical protein